MTREQPGWMTETPSLAWEATGASAPFHQGSTALQISSSRLGVSLPVRHCLIWPRATRVVFATDPAIHLLSVSATHSHGKEGISGGAGEVRHRRLRQ